MNSTQYQVSVKGTPVSWCLRLVDGSMAWSNWPLTEVPLVIGRGLGCRMRLDDSRVSRIQCEVRLVEGEPHLYNRSAACPTHVNGEPRDECVLRLGDLIEFASFRLIVDCLPAAGEAVSVSAHSPTTRMFNDTPFHHETLDQSASGPLSVLAGDLLSLFHFSRQLAQIDSLDGVVAEIRSHLAQRLKPDTRWVAWRTRTDGDMTLYPPASPQDTAAAPMSALLQSCTEGRGLLIQQDTRSIAVAPLQHGGQSYGAICVERDGSREYGDKHLHYLLAVAECAAPHIRAAERLEQWRRDSLRAGNSLDATSRLLGSSAPMVQLRDLLLHAAQGKGSVLLLGETGTGKELAARIIHESSVRADGPYVAVNCAAIPDDLFESEMFGHEKGSFTGAMQRRRGYFEQAHGGTLFLDETGELSMANQARLLRAVDTGIIRRIGSEQELSVDVRIVSATNRPLSGVSSNGFRLDLYHRLAAIVIYLPALRERKGDIAELAQYFLLGCTQDTSARPLSMDPAALEQMLAYDWPGNVRELRNVVERACYLAKGPLAALAEPLVPAQLPPVSEFNAPAIPLEEIERRHLTGILLQHNGDVAAAAQSLGMPKSTLYYKLSKHGVQLKGRRGN